MKYYLIAGEASGDLHGSNLMKGLYAQDPDAQIRFWGGDLMTEVWRGVRNLSDTPSHLESGLVRHFKEGAVMGFVEVLSPCPTGWSLSPVKSMEWIDEKMTEVYPLGVVKDVSKEETQA